MEAAIIVINVDIFGNLACVFALSRFKACEMGTYGSNCSETCGHCVDFCNNTDGRCHGGCQAGWQGDRCLQDKSGTCVLCFTNIQIHYLVRTMFLLFLHNY